MAINQSQPLGNERFHARIERMTGQRREAKPRGKPRLKETTNDAPLQGKASRGIEKNASMVPLVHPVDLLGCDRSELAGLRPNNRHHGLALRFMTRCTATLRSSGRLEA